MAIDTVLIAPLSPLRVANNRPEVMVVIASQLVIYSIMLLVALLMVN